MAELAVALLAMFGRMERVFMRERAAHAREVAQAKGNCQDGPASSTPTSSPGARAVLDASQAVNHVAAAFGVSRATLYRKLAEPVEEQTAP